MIKDLKDLQALFKLCRKQGVNHIEIADMVIEFGDMPKKSAEQTEQEDSEEIQTDELSPEQLMFYSAGGDQP